jgi:hypothetical protein
LDRVRWAIEAHAWRLDGCRGSYAWRLMIVRVFASGKDLFLSFMTI